MLKRKKVKPITLRDVTIIDDGKLRKAITAASLGNAMEWFDFGVYGFVAYALFTSLRRLKYVVSSAT